MAVIREKWDIEEINLLISDFPIRAISVGADALTKIAYFIFAASQDVVPYDTGALSDSGEVGDPDLTADSVTVEIGYGNEDVKYAIIQHEDMEYSHPNGGQAKYLEQPCMEAVATIEDDLGGYFSTIFVR